MAMVMLFLRQTTGKTERYTHFCMSLKPVFTRDCGNGVHFMDEPTNGLDPIGIAEIRTLIRKLSREYGKTILISSHQLSEIEQMVNCVGIIHEGRMLEECSYQQLQENRHSYIRLVVKEPEQVYEYLKNDLSIGKIKKPEASVIEIYDRKYGTLELNSRLFAAGFSVVEISKCRNSLEDYFMELTGGVGIA